MTVSVNQQLWVNDAVFDEPMPIDPALTYFEDTLVWWNKDYIGSDGLVGKILPLSNDTNAANFVGVLRDINPVQVYADKQTPNTPSVMARVTKKAQFSLFCTVGDNVKPGLPVYAGADEQTFTVTAGSNSIGYVAFEQSPIASAVAGDTALINVRAKLNGGL